MRNQVHRRHAAFVLAAFVMAGALPLTIPLSRDSGDAPAELIVPGVVSKVMTDTESATAVPLRPFAADPDGTDAAEQAASMMLVGTLLIGIGSMVRRIV